MNDRADLTLIIAGVHAGTIDPVEVLDRHLAAIRHRNSSLNALRWVDERGARLAAEKLATRRARGETLGALAGTFFSAKDSIDVAGAPRSDGAVGTELAASKSSATMIARLLAADAICIGKGNQAERGRSYFTDNPLFGRTANPYDPDRSPGGSGGGDACAVATGMADFGIGADSGGSVRVPAAFCGVAGIFPTRGIIPTSGLAHPAQSTRLLLRGHGPIARTARECGLALSAMEGFDPADPTSVVMPSTEMLPPEKKRFIFFSEINGVRADRQIRTAIERTARALEDAGFRGEERTPRCWATCYEIFIILAGQAALINEDLMGEGTTDRTTEGPIMVKLRERIASELPPLTPERLLTCWRTADLLRYEAASLFGEFDFVLSPVAATLPPPHGTALYPVDDQKLQSQEVFQFASAVNVLGLPALALPIGVSSEGLPISAQLIGARFSDYRLIALGAQLERTPPWP